MHVNLKHFLMIFSAVILCTAVSFSSVSAASAVMPSSGTAYLNVIDISQWQDSVTTSNDDINFPLLKTQVDAVYIRASGNSNGVPYIDKQAVRYAQSAQNVNLLYGFYYYYIPNADLENARSQARDYYNLIKSFAYSCVPALDVEENPNNLSKASLAASVKAFADEFKALSGFDMMIYSYPDFIKNNFDPSMNWTAYKFWIAHYNVSAPMEGTSSTWMPQSKWCWERWDMWQYKSTGSLSSIPNSSGGYLDLDIATDNILLSTPAAITVLDSPSATGINGGDIYIQGWALSHSGVSRVDIYADDFRWVGSTSNMYARPDIQQAINSNGRYNDGLHSGFAYSVDASFFTVGQHTLILAVVNRNGSVNWSFHNFTVGPISQICLDKPTGQVNSDIEVSGWALSHAGIERVDIYVDNNRLMGSTANLTPRFDVNEVVNGAGLYKNGLNSGFSYTIDASLLTIGAHTVKVAAISRDGSVQWVVSTFNVGMEPQMCLDSPSGDAMLSGDIGIAGWAVSHAGIARIDIYADNNQWIGSTGNMYARSDVNSSVNSNGQYKNGLNSGFSYSIGAGTLSSGTHVLKIAAISLDGSVQWIQRTITIQ